MEFNNTTLKNFRADFQQAVAELEEKYSITLEAGSISYDANEFSMKVSATRADVDVEKANFIRDCMSYGFKPEDYLRQFTDARKTYELTGFNHKARTNKALFREAGTNVRYHGPVSYVKDLMNGGPFSFVTHTPPSGIENLKRRYLTDFHGNEIGETLEQKFFELACRLSPENLHCDGEISAAEANKKYKELRQLWVALELEYGRAVTTIEACEWGA